LPLSWSPKPPFQHLGSLCLGPVALLTIPRRVCISVFLPLTPLSVSAGRHLELLIHSSFSLGQSIRTFSGKKTFKSDYVVLLAHHVGNR
jgi:hypothetical protein